MHLVERDHPDTVRRYLSAEEAVAVRRFCGEGQEVRPEDVRLVEAVLEEMHDGRHVRLWLECDCVGAGASRPRLTARVREEGPRHFVRMHQYGEHRCALALFRQTPESENVGLDDDPARPGQHHPLRPVSDALDYLDNLHEGAARPGGSNGSNGAFGQRGRRLPRLGRILHTLLEDADFARLHVDALQEKSRSWERFEAYAAGQALSPELTLSQILYLKPWIPLNEKMREIDALAWPEMKARSALLLFVADEIRAGGAIKKTSMGECVVRPEKGIRAGGRDQRLTQPPYWVLTVVDRDRDGNARFREAFAQHAHSFARPVPLDSQYERITLKLLFRLMEWVKKHGVGVTLSKPLFDREVRQIDKPSLWCRPDFELTFRSAGAVGVAPRLHRLVIETMGADDPDYLARKSRTHEIMKRRGILIEHQVADDDAQQERDDAFFRRVAAKVLHLAGVPQAKPD
ncbi:conserved hypothetical protein [Paraburkholderia piptadeniae]|uniref:Uncharacterized protein n=2 Tax=Paraburkholderia TaxID=1822464 RepID=A0A7X1TJH5_9BURK|nr:MULTISPECIES: hypothetical protein [Paraburkholderia]MPW21717.1 hypothetical protein [Paraburkholderia franconis]SIT51859.1 conserved hypothetical protein [Paraburkholderia piptadeniae]